MLTKETALKKYFGYDLFRDGQEKIVDTIVDGTDVLAVMPTGAGKSLCYQVPALMLEGVSLVISPLIALMKDQVQALLQSGVSAAFINSSLSSAEMQKVMREAKQGRYKIIYIAPERLLSESFRQFATTAPLSLIAVDEAHCVSHWGHDFRASYLDIKTFINALPQRPVVSAFTATATKEVKEDIIKLLGLREPFLIAAGFDRENLFFEVKRPKDKKTALLRFLKDRVDESGIIYCSTRNTVEETCLLVQAAGHSATRYHAGLSANERNANQEDFIHERKRIIVATNAFGMGIDKSNVSYVVHYNMPKNVESYYQEAGRAGRDGEPAICLLLYAPKDVVTNEYLIKQSETDSQSERAADVALLKERDLDLLRKMTYYCTTSDCLRNYILRYFGEQAQVFCGNCSNCATKFEEVDVSIETQMIISCILRLKKRNRAFGKDMVVKILRGSSDKRLLDYGLDSLSTYGIMKEISSTRAFTIIHYLLEKEIIVQSASEYPVLLATERSLEVLKARQTIIMQLPKTKAEDMPVNAAAKTIPDVDDTLFAKLKNLRRELAGKAHVPAYIVFSDASLRDMCRKGPTNEEQFLDVSGVGQKKLELYGEAFIKTISSHISEN